MEPMKSIAMMLLLATAQVFAAANAEPEIYTATTTGELTVDAEGRVTSVALDPKSLGADLVQDFESQMRAWAFEPILKDGQPVPVKARLSVGLLVIRQPGAENMRIGFERVQFFEPVARKAAEGVSRSLAPPAYPESELRDGIGARVDLLLRLDAEGRVTDAAAETVNLFGEPEPRLRERHGRNFSKSAVRATARWRIPGIEGGVVVVPVTFMPGGVDSNRWIRTHGVAVETPAWVTAERASSGAIALDASGARPSERWKLVTPIGG